MITELESLLKEPSRPERSFSLTTGEEEEKDSSSVFSFSFYIFLKKAFFEK